MSDAKKCDVCGKLYDPTENLESRPFYSEDSKYLRLHLFKVGYCDKNGQMLTFKCRDLCCRCSKDLINFIQNRKESANERPS